MPSSANRIRRSSGRGDGANPHRSLVAVFERDAAPDQAEQQVEVPPVVGVDDVAERYVADEDDIGEEQDRAARDGRETGCGSRRQSSSRS